MNYDIRTVLKAKGRVLLVTAVMSLTKDIESENRVQIFPVLF